MGGYISLKSAKYIMDLLNNNLADKRKELKQQSKDENIPEKVYKKTLASCKEIEYTMKEMENFIWVIF